MAEKIILEGTASPEVQAMVEQLNKILSDLTKRLKRIEDRLSAAGL